MKRKLTEVEIDSIIRSLRDEYRTIRQLPKNMQEVFFDHFFTNIRNSLKNIEIYPQGIPSLIEKMIKKYRLVMPGKSVGIITGQSIGEMQTQTTLNTFHKAGLTEKTVVTGVPRFLEIIDTNRSESQSTPSSFIYLKCRPKNVREARSIVSSKLIYICFSQLVREYKFYAEKCKISYLMNLEILYRYKISLKFIKTRIEESFEEKYSISVSPLHEGIIEIVCCTGCTELQNEMNIYELENNFHNVIMKVHISGVPNIENIFFMRCNENDEWYVETDGSNLKDILDLDVVDSFRTFSNDIWEIYNLFGIEAIRSYLVYELTNLMPSIHKTHISILADRMTVSGKLRSITRYTRKNETTSVLSKATFEETLSNFLNAALNQEKELVNGSSATITCGKVPFVGTGMNELILK